MSTHIHLIYECYYYFIGYQLPTDTDSVRETTSQMSNEDRVYSILRSHYGTISQSLQDPVSIARRLCGEKIIPEETLAAVESTKLSPVEKTAVLLKSIRAAVHTNYHSLWIFGSVLQKFTDNCSLGRSVIVDYGKYNNYY